MLAFTLRKKNFREFDQLLTFYTAGDGKVQAVGKGIKKITARNAAALEPLCLVEIELVRGRDLVYATKATVVENFPNLRRELWKIAAADYALKLIDLMVGEGEKDERLFRLIFSFLKFLDRTEGQPRLLDIYVLKLWELLGFAPRLQGCLECEMKAAPFFFDAGRGGVVCDRCRRGADLLPVSPDTLKIMKESLVLGFEKFTFRPPSPELHGIVTAFSTYHAHQEVPDWQPFFLQLGLA